MRYRMELRDSTARSWFCFCDQSYKDFARPGLGMKSVE
jgi:hypothetical protein